MDSLGIDRVADKDESLSREALTDRLAQRAEAFEDEFTEEKLALLDYSDENVELRTKTWVDRLQRARRAAHPPPVGCDGCCR